MKTERKKLIERLRLDYTASTMALTLMHQAADMLEADSEPKCSEHPDAPHGFSRNASHSVGRYVCECEAVEHEHLNTYKHKPGPNAYDPHLNLHGEREMTHPPLPPPTIIDGRRLYTAGDMRAYGDACVKASNPDSCDWIPPAMGDQAPATQRDTPGYRAAFDDLFSTLGIKK